MRFTIRDYRAEDFDTLWNIDQLCFAPGISYSRRELGFYIRRRNAFTLIAEVDDASHKIFGFIVAEAGDDHVGHVMTIDVLSEARKKGLGSLLLETAERRMRTAGCNLVTLETAVDNAAAITFYKRHNYEIISTFPRYYSNGVDALVLEKNLLPVAASR